MVQFNQSLNEVLAAAIKDMEANGYDSVERLTMWQTRLYDAAKRSMLSENEINKRMADGMKVVYDRMIERGGVLKFNPGVSRFTIEKVKPALRAELARRIVASAELIKLNRDDEIRKTLQRFSGWATSVPKSGSNAINSREVKNNIGKPLKQLSFRERRVLVDQSHKLTASLSDIIAKDGGAIAAIWRSVLTPGYNYRHNHRERDGKVYVVRGNWALSKGFMKTDGHEYTDDITQPAEEISCRCKFQYLFAVRDLPPDMVTVKGRDALKAAGVAA